MKRYFTPGFYRLLLVLVSGLAFLQSAAAARASKTIYDLNSDWSDTQNPNGAWSYNENEVPISVHQQFWWGGFGWGYLWLGDGSILKGSYFEGATDPWGNPIAPAFDWQPGDVMMHALSVPYGGQSTFLNVKWVSPEAGMIDIAGRAWDGEIFADRDVGWVLIVAGKTMAQRSSVIGLHRGDAAAQFSSNLVGDSSLKRIHVHAGDVVEFRVMTETYYGHFLGVDETITLNGRRLKPVASAAITAD